MSRYRWRAWGLGLTAIVLANCSQRPSSIAALERLLDVDSGKWGRIIRDQIERYEKALEQINPHYALAKRISITQPVQRVILCLLAMKNKGGLVVELGAWAGGGALMMAPFLEHRQSYHAVDTFQADAMPDPYVREYLKGRKHLDVFMENIRPIENKLVIQKGTTLQIAAKWPKDRLIDFLFIDADHSFKGVSQDWISWSPFVKKGGIIAFHDYYVQPGADITAVRKFVDQFVAPRAGKSFHFVEGLAWYVVE